MEDYIFLIIAVVISIFAALKKSKKPENLPGVEETERPRNFLMDEFLGDDFLDESDDEVVLPVKLSPVIQREPLVVNSQLKSPSNYRPGFIRTLPELQKNSFQTTVAKITPNEEDEKNEDENSSGILEGFSLRKAFVYSEIMTRKYNSEAESSFSI